MLIQIITLFLLLLVAGVFWGPWLALHRSIAVFSKEEFIKITKTMAANLGRPMQLLMPLCILSVLLSVLMYPDKYTPAWYLLVLSFSCILFTLLITMTVELPVVNTIKTWTPETTPANWEAIRDRWVRFHLLRVLPSLISFCCYAAAIL